MITQKLKDLGLTDKEARVYAAIVTLGSSIASVIAKKAGINRSTTYVILDNLLKHGLINLTEKRGIKYFSPAPAERLVQHLESQSKEYSERAKAARELLPELKKSPVLADSRPRIQFFEGAEGIRTVYGESLNSLETVRVYTPVGSQKISPDYFPNYYSQLAKRKIGVKVIFPGGGEAPKDKTDFLPGISIYDNKVVFVSTAEKSGLIIESKEFADALKQAFDLAWTEAKRTNKKSIFESLSPENA